MSIPTLTFFNNKGGVGKTTLVYHLSWMFSELGVKTLVVDCDPQANLTAAFMKNEDMLEILWERPLEEQPVTIYGAVAPLLETSDVAEPVTYKVSDNLRLLAGDLRLSTFEDELSLQWNQGLSDSGNRRAMMVQSAFWRVAQNRAANMDAKLIIFDVGPNLGAINRSVLIGTDHVVVPLAADMFSLQGLRNLGPSLSNWKKGWHERRQKLGAKPLAQPIPDGDTSPLGYIAMQHQERLSRPVKAYGAWLERMPAEYRSSLSLAKSTKVFASVKDDPECLALLRHYKSLIPMAQEARKPVFLLKSADGAIGSHAASVTQAYNDFKTLAKKILKKIDISVG
jgi:cellulose biosynthesis protein BcsQ